MNPNPRCAEQLPSPNLLKLCKADRLCEGRLDHLPQPEYVAITSPVGKGINAMRLFGPRKGAIRARSLALPLIAAGAVALCAPLPALGATPPKCFSSQLVLKFVSFQGATGHRFWQLAFKNVGPVCSMHGFPTVKLLNHGHVIPATIQHETGPVHTVIVAHGKRGHFTFAYVDGGFCTQHFTATRLRIRPPHDLAPFVFNPVPKNGGPISVCKGSERVSPVRSHPDG